MIGFSIVMWFISIILFIVSISLLRGNYSSMHGKVFNKTKDKVGYAKTSGKPVLLLAIGIALSGMTAVVTSKITVSVIIIIVAAVIMSIWFINIQRKFS